MSSKARIVALFALAALQAAAQGTTAQADAAAASADGPASGASHAIEVVTARPGIETRLRRGQVLGFALYGNASTGYRWTVVKDGSPVLAQVKAGASPVAPPKTPPMPGSGSTAHWRYLAVQPGRTTLELVYRRAWEKQAAPARSVSYPVVVEE